MAQAKSTVLFGLALDLEATYGAGGSIDLAADGIRMTEEVLATIEYGHDGQRGVDPASGRPLKAGPPSARQISFSPSFLVGGGGAAYSATVFPNIHRLLRMGAFDSTLVTTGGSETYTYVLTPLSDTPGSGFGNAYGRGQLYALTHGYANLSYVVEAGGYMTMSADISAVIPAIPTDVSLPAITYSSVMEPKAVAGVLSLGDFITPKWRRVEFQQNRVVTSRMGGNATLGHEGFAVGRYDTKLIVDLEATALVGSPFHTSAGLDAFALDFARTEVTTSLQMGTIQYNKWTHTLANSQLVSVEEPSDGPTGMWRLTFQVNSATSWLFD